MDTVVELIHDMGIWAYVEQTGGGCATIYAGAKYTDNEGDQRYSAIAGPGTYGWDRRPSYGHTTEFYIGPDDQGETDSIDCATAGALTEADLATLIVAHTRLPIGTPLNATAAKRILRNARVERILAAAAAEAVAA